MKEDQFRSNLLYLPAIIVLTGVWLGIGFELLSTVLRINPLFFLLIGTPFLYTGSKFITEELLFPGIFIAFGPCPSCEVENRVYFGKILGVEGFTDIAKSSVLAAKLNSVSNVRRCVLRPFRKHKKSNTMNSSHKEYTYRDRHGSKSNNNTCQDKYRLNNINSSVSDTCSRSFQAFCSGCLDFTIG